MDTPQEQNKTRPFRQWDEEGSLSVKMHRDEDLPPLVNQHWPFDAVDTMLIWWGYSIAEPPDTWMDIDQKLWHHINVLYGLFENQRQGDPSPLDTIAEDDLKEGRAFFSSREQMDQLQREATAQETDNARWIATYTLNWLQVGLQLIATTWQTEAKPRNSISHEPSQD